MGPLSFSREEDASPFDSYCSGSMAGGRGLGLLPTIAHTDFLVITLFSDLNLTLAFLCGWCPEEASFSFSEG